MALSMMTSCRCHQVLDVMYLIWRGTYLKLVSLQPQ